jgi:hypothetical protein
MSRLRRSCVAGLVASVALVAGSACAATYPGYRYPGGAPRHADQRAYAEGYDDGRSHGEHDARRQRSYDYRRHDDYRDADDGYRGYGNRNGYRALYRQGFVEGYADGYRRYGPAASPYPSGRYGIPGGRAYPRYPGAAGIYATPAADHGYRDGFEAGRDDRRDGDRYDPRRPSRYRSGDHGYDSRYGSRDAYKREYRAAFVQGYEQGYR